MPRKNAQKPAKRAKLSGIERIFKDPPQAAQATGTLASHVLSNSGESISCLVRVYHVSKSTSM